MIIQFENVDTDEKTVVTIYRTADGFWPCACDGESCRKKYQSRDALKAHLKGKRWVGPPVPVMIPVSVISPAWFFKNLIK